MSTLRKHAVEAIASIWLLLVAVQYLGRYFVGLDLDYSFAYIGMLVLTIAAVGLRVIKRD